MKNWKTTIGGALSALGTSIAGISTVGAFSLPEYKMVALWCIAGGALLSALGKFFGLLFATDAPKPPAVPPVVSTLVLAGLLAALATGCATDPQTIAFNTIYSVEKTTTATYDGYLDAVVKGAARTNGVPAVTHAYNKFQAAYLVALDGVQFNTNALAPAALQTESQDVINLITNLKGRQAAGGQ